MTPATEPNGAAPRAAGARTSRSSTTTSCWCCAASASTVPDGQIVALLGANGAGKTTLLRALTGLLDIHDGEITKGAVTLDDAPIHRLQPGGDRAARRHAGARGPAGLRRAHRRGEPAGRRRTPTRAATPRTTWSGSTTLFPVLADGAAKTAGYLSGGEQQMLAMGRALMSDPRYLLLDEPSLGLAPALVEQIRDMIVEINQAGTGVLLVEQNATMALSHRRATATSWRPARSCSTSRPTQLLRDDDVREFYLGLHPGEDGRATLVPRRQALPAQEAVVVMTDDRRVRSSRCSDVHLSFAGRERDRRASASRSRPASCSRSSAPTAPARPRMFNVLSGVYRPQRGPVSTSSARTSSASARTGSPALGHGPHLPEHRAVRAT